MNSNDRLNVFDEADGIESPSRYEWCFGCGQSNPFGLKLRKMRHGGLFWCDFTVCKQWCGYPDILHGGIQASVFDEIMGDAANDLAEASVTLEMSFEFISPGRKGMTLRCSARAVSAEGKFIHTKAEMTDLCSGKLISRAIGLYKKVDLNLFTNNMVKN